MAAPKRSSYPSRQQRGGPAPLASFEDLSDEISSPEEPAALLSPDPETEEDTRTYSEGATPSTPRVLAQTPSTPLALDGFSAAGTPDSFGHLNIFPGSSSRPTTPLPPPRQDSNGSVFSPRASPLFGRRSESTTPEPADHRASDSSLDGQSRGGPSPRATRKIFTMAFFKPREERSPSPTASPKSPRRTSPAASPKSPRRASPFAGLFKTKEEPEAGASPTKKRSHFPHFLRPREDRPKEEPASPAETGKKNRVFANLFTRAHHRDKEPDKGTEAAAGPPLRTPEDEEWIACPTRAANQPRETELLPPPPSISEPAESVPDQVLPSGKQGDSGIFESTQDILGADAAVQYDPSLRLGLSPSADGVHGAAALQDVPEPAVATEPVALESPESEAEVPEADPAVLKVALKGKELEAETLLREDSFDAEEFPAPDVPAAPPEKEASRHRDKLAAFRANPVDRPRCTAPVSFATLEAYISKVAPADKVKLKVVLPGEEFEHRERQPKKAVYKSWFEFCEVGLQSPRSRRRQLGTRSPSSFPERQELEPPDERRAESVDLGAVGTANEAWASFEPSDCSSRSSSPEDCAAVSAAALKDEEVQPLVPDEDQAEEANDADYTQILHRDPVRSLPDCVFSVGGEPEAPCWANGVMDLLATLPSPKQDQDARTGYEPAKLIGGQGNGV